MSSPRLRLARSVLPGLVVLIAAAALYVVARPPTTSAAQRRALAAGLHFTELPIALPVGLPERDIRAVNPSYAGIQAWISSVGAGIALNDLDGNGLPDDLCLVDTRSDDVVVTPAPTGAARYAPFVLEPTPLPTDAAVAPMGCAPGDFNGDGRMDLLVYYWGRTPVLFLHTVTSATLSSAAFHPTELVPTLPGPDGEYHGARWNTNAVAIADFDGDGHPDIGVFNYFPDSAVLDPHGQPDVVMNHSMSRATNGGGAHVMRWSGLGTGPEPSVNYVDDTLAIDPAYATGWTLGAASADLDGDLLPELYLANDFGQDRLFHNTSQPGQIRFALLTGGRGPTTPKSMVLGNDSFKGMAADFGDLENNGRFDIFVSNITTPWGLQESNFLWANQASSPADAKSTMDSGRAPFVNRAANLGMAWTGWGWDAKMADFDNSGRLSVVQADGFVKGDIDRWPWLQELAMSNDLMLANPAMWPKVDAGDDIAGGQSLAFWVRGQDGRFVNLSHELGMDVPIPTRGVAVADTTGTGWQDLAVARQWGPPAFYRNDHPSDNAFLGLRLYRPVVGATGTAEPPGSPAYGAVATITTADGLTRTAQLDGGGGHSGKRSFDVFFGLGAAGSQPVAVNLSWRDVDGAVHHQSLDLSSGWHDLLLDTNAREVATR